MGCNKSVQTIYSPGNVGKRFNLYDSYNLLILEKSSEDIDLSRAEAGYFFNSYNEEGKNSNQNIDFQKIHSWAKMFEYYRETEY